MSHYYYLHSPSHMTPHEDPIVKIRKPIWHHAITLVNQLYNRSDLIICKCWISNCLIWFIGINKLIFCLLKLRILYWQIMMPLIGKYWPTVRCHSFINFLSVIANHKLTSFTIAQIYYCQRKKLTTSFNILWGRILFCRYWLCNIF